MSSAPGMGKYGSEALEMMRRLNAKAVVLVVIGGTRGSGASCSQDYEVAIADPGMMHTMPALLRTVADGIERQARATPQ